MEKFAALFFGQFFQFFPHRGFFHVFRKINVFYHGLDIEARAACQNRDFSLGIDFCHGLFCHFLKTDYMKLFFWVQHINEVVGDAFHLFFCNLCRANVHIFVHLHGVRRDNFTVHGLCKGDGKPGLSHGRGTCQYNQRFFQNIHLHNPFEFLFQFVFGHGDNGGSSMRTVIWIVQS